MISRRTWLTQIFGAVTAAAVAPLVDLTDNTVKFWDQAPLQELLKWRIEFPDGKVFAFNAQVVSERITSMIDGTQQVSLDIQPTGQFELLHEKPRAEVVDMSEVVEQPRFISAHGVLIKRDGKTLGDVVDLELPSYESERIDATNPGDHYRSYLPGIRRMGSMKIEFTPE